MAKKEYKMQSEAVRNRGNFYAFLWIAPLFVLALLSMSPTADAAHDAPDCPNGDIKEKKFDSKEGL